MANPNPTRMSPAELRRRLLSPPTDTTAVSVVDEPAPPAMPSRMSQRRNDGTRFGSTSSTQPAIDLDAIQEMAAPAMTKHTPLPESRLNPALFRTREAAAPAIPVARPGEDDTAYLREQNAELTRIVEEMKPLLEEASAQEIRTQTREQEIATELAERDQRFDEMYARLQQLEGQLANVPVPKTQKPRNELEEWNDELEKESSRLNQDRRQIDADRQQLREDEEALEKQMRDMECSMARERAMMARQETELKRLSAEIQHELEMLQRGDGTLREQLSKFQRRHQEVLSRTPPGGGPSPAPAHVPEPPPPAATKDSGFIRRIFRSK